MADTLIYCAAQFGRRCPACRFRASTPGPKLPQYGQTEARKIDPITETPPEVSKRLQLYISDHWQAMHVPGVVTTGG